MGFFPHQTGPFKGIINQIKSISRPRNSYFIVIFDGTHIFHFIFLFATINIRHVNVAWRHDIFTLFLSTIFQHNLCIFVYHIINTKNGDFFENVKMKF